MAERRTEGDVVNAGRQALADTIERLVPPEIALPLIVTAIAGAFADIVAVSPAMPDLIEAINVEIAGAGLRLIPVVRQ